MKTPVFLLGAGFDRDARQCAVRATVAHMDIGPCKFGCDYPLADGLARLCFGEEPSSHSGTVEEMFAEAIAGNDREPLKKLYKALMKADNYIVPRLLPGGDNQDNPYATFFQRFRECQFLTFNYDSLAELFLLHSGTWRPQDGYGVAVEAGLVPAADSACQCRRSKARVLHLHGCLCLYTWGWDTERRPGSDVQRLVPRQTPLYVFDPGAIAYLFSPYTRAPQRTPYIQVEDRVVPPVPNKATVLEQSFTEAVHDLAKGFLESCSRLVAIGYSFNQLDRASYEHLLDALSQSREALAVVVCPDAAALTRRLAKNYPRIHWEAYDDTFERWANASFPGSA